MEPTPPTPEEQAQFERYLIAAHAVQSGVAALMKLDPKLVEEKHMRTGIDMQKAEMAGFADLLINKGVFTRLEYMTAMANAAEDEKARYEAAVSEKWGKPVTLA